MGPSFPESLTIHIQLLGSTRFLGHCEELDNKKVTTGGRNRLSCPSVCRVTLEKTTEYYNDIKILCLRVKLSVSSHQCLPVIPPWRLGKVTCSSLSYPYPGAQTDCSTAAQPNCSRGQCQTHSELPQQLGTQGGKEGSSSFPGAWAGSRCMSVQVAWVPRQDLL